MRITYQEQRISVQRQAHRVKRKTIEPALGVLECFGDVAPSENLVVRRVTIGRESGLDDSSLFLGQETGGVWIIVNEPVREDSDYNSRETLL